MICRFSLSSPYGVSEAVRAIGSAKLRNVTLRIRCSSHVRPDADAAPPPCRPRIRNAHDHPASFQVITLPIVSSNSILVGDIGGTHARFAIVDRAGSVPRLRDWRDLPDHFPTFTQALRHYLDALDRQRIPDTIALAVAGPVADGGVSLTNRNWRVSENELRSFGFRAAQLVNDFAALAYAADLLGPSDLRCIGRDIPGIPGAPITILGAGTGFGVSCLAHCGGHSVPLATEGGHIGFAPQGAEEIAILEALARRFGRVSVERILSGPGLESLSRVLDEIAGRAVRSLSAAAIVEHASQGDVDCRGTLSKFCSIFGAVAGDIALAQGARGGVLIAGGIAGKIERYLLEGSFRERFEAKGRLSSYVKSIPTRLIINPNAALLGAARAAEEFRLD
jgi:glucokinase